jgi:mannose-6-phosphate isomerase-like protein (cupin superfamily)
MKIKKEKLGNFRDKRGILMWVSPKLLKFNYKYLTMGTLKYGCKRGNHYHKKIKEKLLCISGKMTFKLDNDAVDIEEGDIVDIPVNCVHTIYNPFEEIAVFVEFKSEEFSESKHDTFNR